MTGMTLFLEMDSSGQSSRLPGHCPPAYGAACLCRANFAEHENSSQTICTSKQDLMALHAIHSLNSNTKKSSPCSVREHHWFLVYACLGTLVLVLGSLRFVWPTNKIDEQWSQSKNPARPFQLCCSVLIQGRRTAKIFSPFFKSVLIHPNLLNSLLILNEEI